MYRFILFAFDITKLFLPTEFTIMIGELRNSNDKYKCLIEVKLMLRNCLSETSSGEKKISNLLQGSKYTCHNSTQLKKR